MEEKKGETYYRLRFSEILSKEKLISNVDLFKIMQAQRDGAPESFGQIAIKKGILKEEQLANVYKKYFNIAQLSLKTRQIPENLAYLLPVVLLRKYVVFPVQFTSSQKLVLAMVNPLDIQAIKHIETLTKYVVKPFFCVEGEILEKIEKFHLQKEPEVQVIHEDRLVPFNPKEVFSFFQKRKKTSPTPPPIKNQKEEEEIPEIRPMTTVKKTPSSSSENVNFWGEDSPQAKPLPAPPPPPQPSIPVSHIPLNTLLQETTSPEKTVSIKPMGFHQPLTRKIEMTETKLKQQEIASNKLRPIGRLKETKEDTDSHSRKLKPMPLIKGNPATTKITAVPSLKSMITEPSKVIDGPFSLEATQKLAELKEQIEELVEPKFIGVGEQTRRIQRRKLQKRSRPDFYTPIPVQVVEIKRECYQRLTEQMPKLIIEEKLGSWVNPEIVVPAIPISKVEFEFIGHI